ncbi:MAG: M48 family metallopeptidase [Verrucomicrobia bacterium]|nr:M48 family metallopeptidase [Verrucomicrobiota bacterium]MCH8512931.1 M48 family metallopeptidase [Kiritimatiellia bacterium]
MSVSKGVVIYGQSRITYRVREVDRKTLAIEVHPDQRVEVRAPLHCDGEEIRRRVRKRAAWIQRQQDFFRSFEPRSPVRHYVSGETHAYLGRRYRLKWQLADREGVKLDGGFLRVSMPGNASTEQARRLLRSWYRERAIEVFSKELEVCWNSFETMGVPKPELHIRWMNRRWGSLSPRGRLTLNTELVQAPRECIAYVITHELCHLRHPHHGPGFWKQLDRVMPDWAARKRKLEEKMAM